MKFIVFTCLLFLFACCNKPVRYSVYQSLLVNDKKVQVLFVGKNWEIKDAVNAGTISDFEDFHTRLFWSFNPNESLVVIQPHYPYNYFDKVVPLDRFSKEYKLIKPD